MSKNVDSTNKQIVHNWLLWLNNHGLLLLMETNQFCVIRGGVKLYSYLFFFYSFICLWYKKWIIENYTFSCKMDALHLYFILDMCNVRKLTFLFFFLSHLFFSSLCLSIVKKKKEYKNNISFLKNSLSPEEVELSSLFRNNDFEFNTGKLTFCIIRWN